jgi:hypothetical protein
MLRASGWLDALGCSSVVFWLPRAAELNKTASATIPAIFRGLLVKDENKGSSMIFTSPAARHH